MSQPDTISVLLKLPVVAEESLLPESNYADINMIIQKLDNMEPEIRRSRQHVRIASPGPRPKSKSPRASSRSYRNDNPRCGTSNRGQSPSSRRQKPQKCGKWGIHKYQADISMSVTRFGANVKPMGSTFRCRSADGGGLADLQTWARDLIPHHV